MLWWINVIHQFRSIYLPQLGKVKQLLYPDWDHYASPHFALYYSNIGVTRNSKCSCRLILSANAEKFKSNISISVRRRWYGVLFFASGLHRNLKISTAYLGRFNKRVTRFVA